MNPRLTAVLLVLVSVSLTALGWLGWRLAEDVRDRARADRQQVAEDYLLGSLVTLRAVLEGVTMELRRDLDSARSDERVDWWRALARERPLVRQGFALDAAGELTFPRLDQELTQREREFLLRSASVWTSGVRVDHVDQIEGIVPASDWGWRTWYWGVGPHFLFWKRRVEGGALGVEVDRMAFLSRVIAAAPGAEATRFPLPDASVEMVNESGELMYRWGEGQRETGALALASVALPKPLNMWRLHYYAGTDSAAVQSRSSGLLIGLGGVGCGLIGMAFYFYRVSSREMRLARQRVGALNQVAHELKTPMTNIQLYSELALLDWDGDQARARDRVRVVRREAERVSRLTHDLMTFTRLENEGRRRPLQTVVPDAIIERVLGVHRPILETAGLEVITALDAGTPLSLDADALERGLINLLDNAVKYAASGGRLTVVSALEHEGLRLVVADEGPGIPWRLRERIFDPFFRRDQRLEQSQSGVGIGLSIARRLARRAGGDLRLLKREVGAAFELKL